MGRQPAQRIDVTRRTRWWGLLAEHCRHDGEFAVHESSTNGVSTGSLCHVVKKPSTLTEA